jgi:hypothetical protein
MKYNLSIKKYITENTTINNFSCVYSHVPQSEELKEARGEMFSMVNVDGPQNLDAIACVNVFLDKLESEYFTSTLSGIPAMLEKSVTAALFTLNAYLESVNTLDDIIFDFCCCVVKEDIVYFSKVEDGFIYLIRDNNVLDISGSLRDVSNPKIIEQGSGILVSGDKIVLANTVAQNVIIDWSLLSRYSEDELRSLISTNQDANEQLSFIVVELETPKQENIEVAKPVVEQQEEYVAAPVTVPASASAMQEQVKERAHEVGHKTLTLADSAGNKLLDVGQNMWEKVKEKIIYVWNHREQILNFLKEKILGVWHFVLDLKTKYIDKKPLRNRGQLEQQKSFVQVKKNRKPVIAASAIILVFFFIFFFIFLSHINYSHRLDAFNTDVSKVAADIVSANSSNDYSQVDSLYARDIGILKDAKKQNVDSAKIAQLTNQITQAEDKVHNIVPISDPTVLTDLSLNFNGVKPTSLDLLGNQIAITDPSGVYVIPDSGTSSGEKVNSSEITSPLGVATIDAQHVAIYDKANGVLEMDSSMNVTQIAGLGDIKNITAIASFQQNLYFLDPTDSIVYKSVPVGDGYSIATPFITDNSLSSATSLAVDGNVFVSAPSAGILRYYDGKPTPFRIGNLSTIGKPLGPITDVFDSEFLNNLYIVDPQNDRILVLQKPTNGATDTITYNYVKQYVYTGTKGLFTNLMAVAVDSTEQNMYVLSGTKVLKISL